MKGLDSEGANMPPYSNADYANFKTSINPSNRGFWDLRLSGQYHRGITYRVYGANVFFSQKYNNEKIQWLEERLAFYNKIPLGITDEQFYKVQLDNKPIIKRKLVNYINNGHS